MTFSSTHPLYKKVIEVDYSNYSFEELCTLKQSNEEKNKEIEWKYIAQLFDLKSSEAARQKWKRMRIKQGNLPGLHDKTKTKILNASDFHYPFNLPKEVFSNYKNKVDILCLNGDIQDAFGISRYLKKYRLPFIEELIGTRQFLIELINYINPKDVIVNYGNHESRILNALDKKLSDEFMALMPKSSLSLICDTGFWEYDHRKKTKTFYEPLNKVFTDIKVKYTDNWFCRIGQSIFAHPMAFRKGVLKTTEQAYTWFLQSGEEPFDMLCLSHTHHQGLSRLGKTFIYENGCLCEEMDYTESRLMKPHEQGYLFVVQDQNGNFLYDESKLICL